MYNKIVLIGRLGRDPELRQSQGGPMAVFSVATDVGYGEKKRTQWFNCAAYAKVGDVAMKYLKKGKAVFIEGSMQSYRPEPEKEYWSVQVHTLRMLDKADPQQQQQPTPAPMEGLPSENIGF